MSDIHEIGDNGLAFLRPICKYSHNQKQLCLNLMRTMYS